MSAVAQTTTAAREVPGHPATPRPIAPLARRVSVRKPLFVALCALVGAMVVGVSVGPADLSLSTVMSALVSHVPWLGHHAHVSKVQSDIVWQIRLPRVVLGGLVGAMLAGGGAAYQGVFRNPLADPYLLGVAAGAGLGATAVIVAGTQNSALLPVAAFLGAVGAVTLTYLVGATVGRRGASTSIVLAGVAVAALLTAIQTYLQQQHEPDLQGVYAWILGSFNTASWSDVVLILPYVILSAIVLVAHRRLLDVLRVGDDEADTVGARREVVEVVTAVEAGERAVLIRVETAVVVGVQKHPDRPQAGFPGVLGTVSVRVVVNVT